MVRKIPLPVSSVVIQDVQVDIARINDPTLRGSRYQDPTRLDENLRIACLIRDGYRCQHCKSFAIRRNQANPSPTKVVALHIGCRSACRDEQAHHTDRRKASPHLHQLMCFEREQVVRKQVPIGPIAAKHLVPGNPGIVEKFLMPWERREPVRIADFARFEAYPVSFCPP